MPLYEVEFSGEGSGTKGLFFEETETQLRLSFDLWRREPRSIKRCKPGSSATKYLSRIRSTRFGIESRNDVSWDTLATICEYLCSAAIDTELDLESLERATQRKFHSKTVVNALTSVCELLRGGGELRHIATFFPERMAPIVDRTLEHAKSEEKLQESLNALVELCTANADTKNSASYWIRSGAGALGVLMLFVAGMTSIVIPQFASIYTAMGDSRLPFITELVFRISEVLSPNFWSLLLLILLATALGVSILQRTLIFKSKIHDIYLILPVLGRLEKSQMLAQYAYLSGLMASLGVSEEEILLLMSKSYPSSSAEKTLYGAFTLSCSGRPLSEALSMGSFFDATFIWLAETKQEVTSSRHVGARYLDRLHKRSEALSVSFPILFMTACGLIVGFFVIALLLMPLLNLSSISMV